MNNAMFQQMFSGMFQSSITWLQVALFLSLAGVLVYRPNAIRSYTSFRWSCSCLALSVVVPAVLGVVINTIAATEAPSSYQGARPLLMFSLSGALAPSLVGLSIFLCLNSLAPTVLQARAESTPAPNKPHPLD